MNLRKNKKRFKYIYCILFGLTALVLNSCYTLSGSSIDPNWETIKISNFPNYAPYQNPNLSQQFTDQLQDIFNNRTKLSLTNSEDADLLIDGEITNYQQSSVAIQANETAGKNRLTMTVRVRYQNTKDETKSFDRTFSAYEDFDANLTLMQAESGLLDSILEQLTGQIFNAIAMDW
ncbi:MAG: LptE family protein [Flavobacteriia bacterium]|nr:LptE family protein [Flavobacteriia bacterium]